MSVLTRGTNLRAVGDRLDGRVRRSFPVRTLPFVLAPGGERGLVIGVRGLDGVGTLAGAVRNKRTAADDRTRVRLHQLAAL